MEICLFVIWENIRIIFYTIDFGLTAFLIKWKLWGYVYLEVKHRWKSKVTLTHWSLIFKTAHVIDMLKYQFLKKKLKPKSRP